MSLTNGEEIIYRYICSKGSVQRKFSSINDSLSYWIDNEEDEDVSTIDFNTREEMTALLEKALHDERMARIISAEAFRIEKEGGLESETDNSISDEIVLPEFVYNF